MLLCVPLLLAACSGDRNNLNLIEREMLRYKVDNEGLRGADLAARYKALKRKADQLSADLLALGRERDRLYEEYDARRSELAALARRSRAAAERKAAMDKDLAQLRRAAQQLEREVAAERKSIAGLRQELEKLKRERKALATRQQGAAPANPG